MQYKQFKALVLTILIGASIVLTGVSIPSPAHADSLAVIPPRFELFGNPGDTVIEKLKVNNGSTSSNSYTIDIVNFTAQGEEGGIDLSDTKTSTNYALAQWITVEPSQFSIDAGGEQVLNIAVKIPKNGEPGGHYASVLVHQTGQPAAGGTAAVASRVGSLILLRVSGNVTEKASVESFNVDESFAQYGPVTFNLRAKNEGNVHIAPVGTIVITNIFGKKVKEIPITSANVLPGAIRATKTTWDEKNLIGRYTATLVATYGQQNQTLSASTSFIVFPLYLLWIIIAIVVILFLAITQRRQLKKIINRITSD